MKKIFVVDDEKDIREIIADKLKKLNFEVDLASNGKDALASIKINPPDLILLDVAMPIMDGYETCRKLKEDKATEHIPVIFLTGKDLDLQGVLKRSREFGAAGYISKPSTFEELLGKIKEVLG